MATRIRLQRRGKKHQPYYTIVVADSSAPRDGRFIEKLGYYDPMTDPATIEIDIDRALYWLQVGAKPSETARSLLSNKGVMLKFHLWKGIQKGALTEEEAEQKFQQWLKEKEERVNKAKESKRQKEKELYQRKLEQEKQVRIKKEEILAAKQAEKTEKENQTENHTENHTEEPAEVPTEEKTDLEEENTQ
ncbi:MAG: 30S ribosomal protein S16 [Bacteroidales bacterium]|jgi:small subunit ribosomal protein S16|nr:30S ribosomal protein S16 [Bacteroidales bacterium]MDI9575448.1 30S ribosomal protein S16 [Bacteroidota bacterium]MDD2593612.1 30S ribosomal protein S16 [Bacteroidales bacterium]MDD3756149.1 30S ribosomal protein S16 [Bacteroidales bacterium]MDY0401404.1 30S ribosomal protein S16 [Bacteroidales bacterium]